MDVGGDSCVKEVYTFHCLCSVGDSRTFLSSAVTCFFHEYLILLFKKVPDVFVFELDPGKDNEQQFLC